MVPKYKLCPLHQQLGIRSASNVKFSGILECLHWLPWLDIPNPKKSSIWNILNPQTYAQNVFNFSFRCLLCPATVMPTCICWVSHLRNVRNRTFTLTSPWFTRGLAITGVSETHSSESEPDKCNQPCLSLQVTWPAILLIVSTHS